MPRNKIVGKQHYEPENIYLQPKAKRFGRLRYALDHALARGTLVTGRGMERLLGHAGAMLCVRRELLAIIEKCYVYVQRPYGRRQPLWPSVRRELSWLRALLPVAVADMRRPWSPSVLCYDSSPSGFGSGVVV